MNILLIEDNPIHLRLIKRAINNCGWGEDVFCLEDGEQAMLYFDREIFSLPNLIFLDINLPKVGGIEVLKKAKSTKRFQNIPIVILTTSDNNEDRDKCLSYNADDYIVKSFDFNEFMTKITKIINDWLGINK